MHQRRGDLHFGWPAPRRCPGNLETWRSAGFHTPQGLMSSGATPRNRKRSPIVDSLLRLSTSNNQEFAWTRIGLKALRTKPKAA